MAASPAQSRPNVKVPLPDEEAVKCVVVGDSGVGKTKLVCARATCMRYSLQQLLQSHVPTVWAIDHYVTDEQTLNRSYQQVDGVRVSLRLWDTFGDHDKDRHFAFGRADVVLLCFSVVRPNSLKHAKHVWVKEIRKYCPTAPIIVVGCQIDLRYLYKDPQFLGIAKGPFFREIKEQDILYPQEGRLFAESIGAGYYEVTVLTNFGVKEVFDSVIRVGLLSRASGRFWVSEYRRVQPPQMQEPHLPPEPALPAVSASPLLLEQDFTGLLRDGVFHDVLFSVQGHRVKAHKIILSLGSPGLRALLESAMPPASWSYVDHNIQEDHTDTSLLISLDEPERTSYPVCYSSVLQHPVFDSITAKLENGRYIPIFNVAPCVCKESFDELLRFLYSGELSQGHRSSQVTRQLIYLGETLKIGELQIAASRSSSEHEHIQKQQFLIRRTSNLRIYGLQHSLFSDITIKLDDGDVASHKIILAGRCDFMRAMLKERFREGISSAAQFPDVGRGPLLILLNALYCGHVPDDESHTHYLEAIELANRLCLPDVLHALEAACVKKLERLKVDGRDIIGLVFQVLEPAQLFNASRLAKWCLTFLSTNYLTVFRRHHRDLSNLHELNKEYLIKNRWPPLWYLKELDNYHKLMREESHKRSKPKCPPSKKQCTEQQPLNPGCLCFANCSRSLNQNAEATQFET